MSKTAAVRRSRRAPATLALCALAASGFWLYSSHGRTELGRGSEGDLLRMLRGSEEEAAMAQEEMERRYGTASLSHWRPALESQEARARALAVESVGKTRSPEVVKLLSAALEDPASAVRLNAVQALASQDPRLALRAMLAAVRDDDTWVSEAAANKLRDLKRKEAVPELIAALRNPDRETGVFAMADLKLLTGQKFHAGRPDSPEKWNRVVSEWEQWWSKARPTWPSSPDAAGIEPIPPARSFPAPDFHLTDANGRDISLRDLRGKVVLLNFWMTNCGPCMEEEGGLRAVAARYAGRGLVVVGVESSGADAETVRRYASSRRISYPLAPGSAAVLEAFGHIHDVPVSFLIDRQGRVRYQWDGDREESVFDAAIRRIIAR